MVPRVYEKLLHFMCSVGWGRLSISLHPGVDMLAYPSMAAPYDCRYLLLMNITFREYCHLSLHRTLYFEGSLLQFIISHHTINSLLVPSAINAILDMVHIPLPFVWRESLLYKQVFLIVLLTKFGSWEAVKNDSFPKRANNFSFERTHAIGE